MVDPKLVSDWIEKAAEDLKFAKTSLKEDLEFYPQNLGRLVKICGKKDSEFNQYFDKLADLNTYYIETRYPDFEVQVNKSQAENALNLAEQVATFVKEKLKEAVEGEVVEEEKKEE